MAEGAATAVYLASWPEVENVSGRYFADCVQTQPSKAARDPSTQRRLWELSAAFLDIDEPLAKATE